MNIQSDLVGASIASWKKKIRPDQLARELGEGDRSRYVSSEERRHRLRELLGQARDPVVARTQLERIIEGNDLVGVNYLAIGMARARSVCRIQLRDAQRLVGYATGFLIGPGVLMTNHHVIGRAEDAQYSLAEFDYEYDIDGIDKPVACFRLLVDPPPITSQALDFALVAVAPRTVDGKRGLDEFGWLPLDGTPGKAIIGEYLTIIQHPGGERKQVCVRENKLLRYDPNGTTLWYATDTVAGSSGSPAFNGTWSVVALHHSGVPASDQWDPSMDETQVKWIANEGIRISSIVQHLSKNHATDALARPVLQPTTPPRRARSADPPELQNAARTDVVGDELRVTIPVCVSMRLAMTSQLEPSAAQPSAIVAPTSVPAPATRVAARRAVPLGIEKVDVDQSNYDERVGYDPEFLGDGARAVALPQVVDPALTPQLLVVKANGHQTHELKYWNYSVVMNKQRRLAFFSIVNVDPELRPRDAGRDGDRWYIDPRIDAKYQLGSDFYGQQREVEVDRTHTPFDRGHLTRRLDAQWGDGADEAKRNGDDSFHWTNCSPQHWRYNQGAKRWLGLEDYVIERFARDRGRRAIVINGPVFDAPLSTVGEGGRVVPKLKGAAMADPTFGAIAIPKIFFKIVVAARGPALVAAAFLMSQEDLLATIEGLQGLPPLPEEKLTDAEARLFQVSIADVAELTGIDFGAALRGADVITSESLAARGPRRIEALEQILL